MKGGIELRRRKKTSAAPRQSAGARSSEKLGAGATRRRNPPRAGRRKGSLRERMVRTRATADKGGAGAQCRSARGEERGIRDHHKGGGARGAGSSYGHRCQACQAAGAYVRGGVETPEEGGVELAPQSRRSERDPAAEGGRMPSVVEAA